MVHCKDPVLDPLQYSPDGAHQSWSTHSCRLSHTVKTFGLLQPYFGHLSCMPVVCVTH